jgi:hypothetical protein
MPFRHVTIFSAGWEFLNDRIRCREGEMAVALDLSAIGNKMGPLRRDYTWKDVIPHAVGVGAGFEELDSICTDKDVF